MTTPKRPEKGKKNCKACYGKGVLALLGNSGITEPCPLCSPNVGCQPADTPSGLIDYKSLWPTGRITTPELITFFLQRQAQLTRKQTIEECMAALENSPISGDREIRSELVFEVLEKLLPD